MRQGIALVFVGLCGLGCGGDDEDGGAVSTGLPSNEKLSELDAEQVMQACTNLVADLDASLTSESERLRCTLRAIPMSISVTLSGQAMGDVGKCRDLVNRCLSGEDIGGTAPAPFAPVGSQIDCTSNQAVLATMMCDATVGEYEACLNSIVAGAQTAFRSIDCGLVENPEQLQDMPQPAAPELPSNCADLDDRCPALGIPAVGASMAP